MSEVINQSVPIAEPLSDQGRLLTDAYSKLDPVLGFFSDYPFAIFIVVVCVSLILAKVVSSILTTLIAQLTSRTKSHWDDQINRLLSRPVFWTLFLFGLLMAVIPLKLSPASDSITQSLVATVLIILWSSFFLRMIVVVLRAISINAKQQSLIRQQTRPLFQNLAYIFIFIITVYLIFSSWHIDMTAWLASAGIVGIAIGLLQKIP